MSGRVRVLVPVAVIEGQTVDQGIVDLLADESVVLLGYHVIPEQTAPEQARSSFEDRAQQELSEIQEAFARVGAEPETSLVFTHDRKQTFERVARETDCDALLWLNPANVVEDVLVPLTAEVDADRIGRFVALLAAHSDLRVHLLAIGEDVEDHLAWVHAQFDSEGIPDDLVTDERVTGERPVQTIVEIGSAYDAIVLGERAESLTELVLGDIEERIAEASIGPVFEVLREPAE